jgi:nitrogen fixation/metabolism regulation signal transduction histidine kinase
MLVATEFLAGRHGPGQHTLAVTVLFLSVIGLIAGLATAAFAPSSVADPLRSIRLALAEVEQGNIDAVVAVNDGTNSEAALSRALGAEASRWALGEAVTLRGRLRPTRTGAPV